MGGWKREQNPSTTHSPSLPGSLTTSVHTHSTNSGGAGRALNGMAETAERDTGTRKSHLRLQSNVWGSRAGQEVLGERLPSCCRKQI